MTIDRRLVANHLSAPAKHCTGFVFLRGGGHSLPLLIHQKENEHKKKTQPTQIIMSSDEEVSVVEEYNEEEEITDLSNRYASID